MTYEVVIFAADDLQGGPAAVGTFTHVFVDSQSRKSATMSSELRAGLQKLLVQGENLSMKSKL